MAISVKLGERKVWKVNVGVASTGTRDHTKLENRDTADQHPINSISGLEKALSQKAAAQDLKGHVDNKQNPHGLTAEQVGARPSDWMPSASEVGARPDNWMPSASEVGARPDNWMPSASEVGARPNTWLPTPEQIGAAPSGYGLGSTNGKVVTDANNATNNGWYTIYNGGSNLPGSSFGGSIHVKAFPANNIIQHLYYSGHGGGECRRICTAGTWGDWEFVTPPLYAGVEYRTTERYNGNAVYTKLLDCGTVTNGKAVNHGVGSGLIRMAPVCSGILSTTIKDQSDDWAWVVSADQTAVRMTCGSGIAGNASWKTQIWYTKD